MLEEPKKRKACQACTKAKAKCSALEDSLDICYRCRRLNKECIFDESIRKRAPKNRSRVKQLEQRVETLIDLLANGQTSQANSTSTSSQPPSAPATVQDVHMPLVTPPSSAADLDGRSENTHTSYETPEESPKQISLFHAGSSCSAYDPVEAGLLDDITADCLVEEFKNSYVSNFPFVVIPPAVSGRALRRSQPFLFHAIITVTLHSKGDLQLVLAAKFVEQISRRVINNSQKNLELTQGLLVFAAWYHLYYDPMNQQIATVVQLCVAMIQDLGFSKNPQNANKMAKRVLGANGESMQSLAQKRVFLGTFYLASNFSQAWRRQATLTYTRYMERCCQYLADCQEYQTDTIITPLIQLSDLICRVNTYFSYDDIENAEVKGESLVHLSVANFERELARITDSIPKPLLQENLTLRLSIRLVNIWIYECAVHGSLWVKPGLFSSDDMTQNRLRTLHSCLTAVQSYIKTTIAISDTSLPSLGFPSWSGWCYACIMACKLVFLTKDDEQWNGVNETFLEVLNLVQDKSLHREPEPCFLPADITSSTWNPIFVATEGEILSLFQKMYSKIKFTLPKDLNDHFCEDNPLCRIAYFQKNLLCKLTDQLNEHVLSLGSTDDADQRRKDANAVVLRENWLAPQVGFVNQKPEGSRIRLMQNLNFNAIDFGTIAPPDESTSRDGTFEDWLWSTTMDDFNISPM